MLSTIFRSPQATQLVRWFVFHPGKSVTAEDLSRELTLGASVTRQSLGKLVRAMVIAKDGTSYQLPRTFLLLSELQSLFLKTEILLQGSLLTELKQSKGLGLIVLSGRFVMRADTPIDLLLVGKVNRGKFARRMRRFEQAGLVVQYSILSKKQFQERWSITDRFLYSLFEGKHEILLDLWGLVSVKSE